MHQSMFLHAPLPLSASWDENRQQTRRPRTQPVMTTLSTDELVASKPEIVCSGILGVCFLYTLFHVLAQMAS